MKGHLVQRICYGYHMLAVATPVARRMAKHHRRLFTLPSEVRSGLYLTGRGLGVEPPREHF